jgi:hypothetical protein
VAVATPWASVRAPPMSMNQKVKTEYVACTGRRAGKVQKGLPASSGSFYHTLTIPGLCEAGTWVFQQGASFPASPANTMWLKHPIYWSNSSKTAA